MSLKFAILGYLSTAPGSGYDLTQQLDGGLGWFWSASHSQIYPELKQLEKDGLIESAATTVGEKLEKTVYSIRPEGLELLAKWAGEAPRYRPNRDPERLQLIFSDLGSAERIREHLEAHRRHFAERRDKLEAMQSAILERRHARVEERLKNRTTEQQELTLLLRELAYSGDIERAEQEVAWAEAALARLDEL